MQLAFHDLACSLTGIASSKEHISADDADLLLHEISRRFQHALPATATFMHGSNAGLGIMRQPIHCGPDFAESTAVQTLLQLVTCGE
jgi:hypothetical protein